MKFSVTVEKCASTDEYYVVLPEPLLKKLKWVTGDKIKWTNNRDGSYILTKHEDGKRNKIKN